MKASGAAEPSHAHAGAVQRQRGLVPRWACLAATLLTAVPLLWPTVPPLTDLLGHMGRYHVQLEIARSPFLSQWFEFHWSLIGNLGLDLLIEALAPLFGVEAGTKLLVIGTVLVTAGGFLWLAREIHGHVPVTSLFALPLALNFAFTFGFINFCLSMGLAFCAYAWWLRLGRTRAGRTRAILFAVVAPLVWVTHVYGWAILVILCTTGEFREAWRERSTASSLFKRLSATAMRTFQQCATLLLPLVLMVAWRSDAGGSTGRWFEPFLKLRWTAYVLRDRWMIFDLASAVLLAGVILLGLFGKFGFRTAPRMHLSALALAVCIVILPTDIFGSAWAAQRLIPYLFAVLLISIAPLSQAGTSMRRIVTVVAVGFLGARIAAQTASFALYDQTYDQELAALDHVPRGSRIVSLVVRCEDGWKNSRLDHLPSLAIVRKDAFTNDQWAASGAQLIRVRYHAAEPFTSDPSQLIYKPDCAASPEIPEATLATIPYGAFDFLWVINVPQAHLPRRPNLQPVWRSADAGLFRIVR